MRSKFAQKVLEIETWPNFDRVMARACPTQLEAWEGIKAGKSIAQIARERGCLAPAGVYTSLQNLYGRACRLRYKTVFRGEG